MKEKTMECVVRGVLKRLMLLLCVSGTLLLLVACPDDTGTNTPAPPAPSDVTALTATAGARQVTLRWTKPSDSGYSGVTIVRQRGSTAPASCAMADGVRLIQVDGSTTVMYVVDALSNGVEYSFRVCAKYSNGNLAAGVTTSSTPLNQFNLASCYRLYGADDCRVAATSVAMGEVIGVVAAAGATSFSISEGDDASEFTIDNAGVLTAAKAINNIDAMFSRRLVIGIRIGAGGASRVIMITNDAATATMGIAPIGDISATSEGGVTLNPDTVVAGRCSKCVSSTYSGASGGWSAPLLGAAIDLRPYRTVHISYNVASGSTGFEFRMESAGVTTGGHMLGSSDITADGMWQEVSFPINSFAGVNLAAITVPLGFYNQGTDKELIIDEVYVR